MILDQSESHQNFFGQPVSALSNQMVINSISSNKQGNTDQNILPAEDRISPTKMLSHTEGQSSNPSNSFNNQMPSESKQSQPLHDVMMVPEVEEQSEPVSSTSSKVMVNDIMPLIKPEIQHKLCHEVKKKILPEVREQVRKQLHKEIEEQHRLTTQQQIESVKEQCKQAIMQFSQDINLKESQLTQANQEAMRMRDIMTQKDKQCEDYRRMETEKQM